MIIGRLNRLFTFQRKSVSVNATGNETETYTDLFTAQGSIQPLRGKESTQAGEIVATNFWIIKNEKKKTQEFRKPTYAIKHLCTPSSYFRLSRQPQTSQIDQAMVQKPAGKEPSWPG